MRERQRNKVNQMKTARHTLYFVRCAVRILRSKQSITEMFGRRQAKTMAMAEANREALRAA